MSNRISQGSPFQPAMLKGPDAPTAPAVATRPQPQPAPAPAPPPPVDEFVRTEVRDFTRVVGEAGATASARGNGDIIVRGDDGGKHSEPTIHNPGGFTIC